MHMHLERHTDKIRYQRLKQVEGWPSPFSLNIVDRPASLAGWISLECSHAKDSVGSSRMISQYPELFIEEPSQMSTDGSEDVA